MDVQSNRRPRRKPLSDLSNAPSLFPPAAAYKSKLRPRYSAVTNSSASSDVPVISANCSTTGSTAPSIPTSGKVRASSQIGLQTISSSVCGAGNYEGDEHSTLNMAQREEKEMEAEKNNSAISAANWPQLRKNRNTGRMKQVGGSLPSACSAPHQKKKRRKRQIESSGYELPQDFINEQRAFFKDVDAFELCEEFISESEAEPEEEQQELFSIF